ncbi:bifunctional diaminohydroxyphosphoribosylaminopyrimidine deaminase/5-amino-6-(5-phosphoribosylamino)uracil reductase RibD [Geobacter sp. AOG1]|uniref:bifunctional diaminohydroxyphosphoribosylaminopyrimidine deaminase/5-amino-6-(5-phosphoribosylamino)uracil reductase RibD n=1 Tax=Geobacter sp. AOG1 TaxID=1566346 RepID=UPI001CC6FE46|nr:bifunctional diaminohydroxyphosphoribosylaminopyrimidine deaminase/5-amino-6-(5-phosphoribosylamino)uracil reductase RibD [Geobacter sp. AOG1]
MMRRALALARKGVGKTSPNPAVGCVVVRDGVIVGEGWHRKAGTPHAEVHALAQAGDAARGADVYVTLEPCAHHGKTPPCADALVEAKVGRVFVGMVDPNPLVAGRGLELLRRAGIVTESGLLEEECHRLNEPFIKHVTTGRPFVILKSALTLDGKIATATGDSRWITNDRSRRYVHKLRSEMDAVMVGAGTVLADDPQLTSRLPGGKDPMRVVVDSTLRIPLHARLLHLHSSAPTVIATTSGDEAKIVRLEAAGAEVLRCAGFNGHVDLTDLLRQLGERGVQSVLLEGGRELAGSALHRGLIDKFLFFYAPKIVGGDGLDPFAGPGAERIDRTLRLARIATRRFGDDILLEGYPEAACSQV